MITVEPFLSSERGQANDPVLAGVTRGLAQVLSPIEAGDLPDHLAELVRLLQDGEGGQEG